MIEQDRQRLHQLVESIPSRELVHRTISNLELSISEEGLDRHLTTKDTEQRSQVAMAASGSSAPVGRLALDNVDDCFTYHSPGYDTQERMTQVRESSIALAKVILRVVPDCPDRSTALRELRNVRMWANSALALGGRF